MRGEVGILNVGAGDTKLVFDPRKPAEVERASRIVKDMIRRGFALLIQIGEQDGEPIYRRARDFDETTAEYIIAGDAGVTESEHDEKPAGAAGRSGKAKGAGKARIRRIPAASTNAVAVARTAGG